MTEYAVILASNESYTLAEGPVWDDANDRVLWVDIPAGTVHVGELSDSTVTVTESHHVDDTVGAVATTKSGDFLVAGHHSTFLLTQKGEVTKINDLIPEGEHRRLNDGACDPGGRFLIGSLPLDGTLKQESLYQIDPVEGVSIVDRDLSLSNGIAWSPTGDVLYNVDTTPGIVWARSYDPKTGLSGERAVALRVSDGSPDGICVDEDNNLWVAVWGRGEVRCYTPEGTLRSRVMVPAPHTSSVAFVGPELDRLLITTAKDDLSAEQRSDYPLSGHLFLADVGVRGTPTSSWS